MKKLLITTAFVATATMTTAQETILNPAIDQETIAQLQQQVVELEQKLAASRDFVDERSDELFTQRDKIENADADTQKIIDDLTALADAFKTGSQVQIAVRDSMEDVEAFIDDFRAGSPAQQAAAAQLQDTLNSMRETDNRRNEAVGRALTEIRRLEAMKGDLVALRIAGAFGEMERLYDQMVTDFEARVDEAAALADSVETLTVLPVQ